MRAGALQSLASVYQQEQRFADAADAFQQATAALNASGKPEMQQQTVWTRMNMARMLNQAGQTPAADKIYEQLLAETANAPEGTYQQVLTDYANYLGDTKRNPQGQALLKDYLASHSNLQPQEETNLLFQLSYGARRSGDTRLAEQYQQAAQEKQRATQPALAPQILIGPDLQAAQTAANAGKLNQAFEIAMQAMAIAPRAVDRDQVTWQISNLASQFVNHKQPAKAEDLHLRVFGTVETWSADNPQALITATQNYARFLMYSDRWNEAPAAIKRYRDLIVATHGEASISVADTLRLTMDFERQHGTPGDVIKSAQELVALHESLAGNTSYLYLGAAEELARAYQSNRDFSRATQLLRENAAIADVAFRPTDMRRAQFRITAAMALAQERQFDEAERLAIEAVAISKVMLPPQADAFTNQLQQIRKMRAAAQSNR